MLAVRETHTPPKAVSRRGEVRARSFAEFIERALEQVAARGPDAVSLSGVARAMRMSGPALYRYFSSRDDLLATLVACTYHLADHLPPPRTAPRAAPRGSLPARSLPPTGAVRWASRTDTG